LSKDLTPVSITLEEFISVLIPFSIELLSKSTFEAPHFILFYFLVLFIDLAASEVEQ
jgi:hypothetical protein